MSLLKSVVIPVPLRKFLLSAVILLTSANLSHAGSAIWSTSNLQYLYGSNFELGDSTRSTATFEHANGWAYGDNFFFVDITNPERTWNQTETGLYAEFSPRISIGKVTKRDLSFGLVKDVLVAGQVEAGEGFHNYLYGVGFSLALPKFAFFDLNVYARNNPEQEGTTFQVTPAWALPFSLGSTQLVFEGFADIAGTEGSAKHNIDFQPRLLVDLGNFWGAPDNIWGGIEYVYWNNKFGVNGVDEYAPQAMVKWVF